MAATASVESHYTEYLEQVTETTPRQFRSLLSRLLARWGLAALADDAAFVVTELLTNVYQHTDRSCRVMLLGTPQGLHVQVRDYSTATPAQLAAEDTAEGGRGFAAVAALVSTLIVRLVPDGKVVSVFLATPHL